MPTPRNPIEFVRNLANSKQLAGNRVQLEDENAAAHNALNPLPVVGDLEVVEESIPLLVADRNLPVANTAAVVLYAGVANQGHSISGLAWSYDDDPTGGNLIIEDGANTVFSIDITTGGPGFIPFDPPQNGRDGELMRITLAAGGAAVVGKINVLGHKLV